MVGEGISRSLDIFMESGNSQEEAYVIAALLLSRGIA